LISVNASSAAMGQMIFYSTVYYVRTLAMLATDVSRTGKLLARLAEWWRERKMNRVRIEELEHCGPEAEFIARDVGLSLTDLHLIAGRRQTAPELLHLRLAALEIDSQRLARTSPYVMRDLQRVCSLCRGRQRCARDLRSFSRHPQWRHYCPNVLTFDAIKTEIAGVNSAAGAQAPCPDEPRNFTSQH